MAKYKCCWCGKTFDKYIKVQESRGEFWGMPAYETVCYSPCCMDGFEEVEEDED